MTWPLLAVARRHPCPSSVFVLGLLPTILHSLLSLLVTFRFFADENSFTGPLPQAIGQWFLLDEIWINSNGFNSTIPESIINWSSIDSAYFEDNDFTGSMPLCSVDDLWSDISALAVDCGKVECSCCTECY